MKRRAINASDMLDTEESKYSKILFNKSENLVQNLKHHAKNLDNNEYDMIPAWVDEDDDNFRANIIPNIKSKGLYVDKLKQKYETLMGTPSWAKLNNCSKSEQDEEILHTVGHLQKESKTKTKGLKKDYLEIKRFPTLNGKTQNEGKISCIEFHPKSSVALVAGSTGIVSLFSVGKDEHEILHSFKIKKWNISTAIFAPNGKEAYISSRDFHYFCLYDLIKAEPQVIQLPQIIKRPKVFKLSPDGNYIAVADMYDEAYIMCAKSKELLRVLKHNSNISSLTFSHDSKQLYAYGCLGEITVWDLSTYKSIQKFYDNGCVNASQIAISPCGKLLVTGSREGIVNIYQTENLNNSTPMPHKTISHLTTAITNMKFNPTTEILAISSSLYPEALKMVHIPSYHVFMNFPRQEFKLRKVNVVNFSPNGGFMGLGNDSGLAFLYRLKYYKNY